MFSSHGSIMRCPRAMMSDHKSVTTAKPRPKRVHVGCTNMHTSKSMSALPSYHDPHHEHSDHLAQYSHTDTLTLSSSASSSSLSSPSSSSTYVQSKLSSAALLQQCRHDQEKTAKHSSSLTGVTHFLSPIKTHDHVMSTTSLSASGSTRPQTSLGMITTTTTTDEVRR